jgi:hypothetical protein
MRTCDEGSQSGPDLIAGAAAVRMIFQ